MMETVVRAQMFNPVTVDADAVVIGVFAEGGMTDAARAVDESTGGVIGRLMDAGDISGKPLELVTILAPPDVKSLRVIVVGLGVREEFQLGTMFRASAAAARQLAARQLARIAVCLPDAGQAEMVANGVCGALVGSQGQDLFRQEKKRFPFAELIWQTPLSQGVEEGAILGRAVNLTRRLVNEPANRIYPASFAEAAREVGGTCGVQVEVWDEERLLQERCGAMLAVARGSVQPPRLVIMRYQGAAAERPPLALIGKGVTFDSGGLSLKTTENMETMKCDMAGAATVLGAIQAIAQLKLPVNVLALMGLVENMPGGAAYKLGDILTSRSGRTIEVHNTDAEGRLVLADVLCVAIERGASKLIDLATLTGACMVALGTDVAGVMTNDDRWCGELMEAADHCGERVWQLPMFPEYDEQIKGEVADIKNVGNGRWGGAITAAKFLEQFVGETPWTHIDIAGPAFLDKPKPWCDGGASGALVRTLVEVARRWGH